MKICSHCGESNADDRNDCWKCGQPLAGGVEKKFCTKCHETCVTQSNICPMCNGLLASFSEHEKPEVEKSDVPLYILALLFPIFGLIFGIIQIAKEKYTGISLILCSIVSSAVYFVIFTLMQ